MLSYKRINKASANKEFSESAIGSHCAI